MVVTAAMAQELEDNKREVCSRDRRADSDSSNPDGSGGARHASGGVRWRGTGEGRGQGTANSRVHGTDNFFDF